MSMANSCTESMSPERIEEFRKKHLIDERRGDPEWVFEENRALNAICDLALKALESSPATLDSAAPHKET
jgi:hypothetical protein